MRLEHEADLVSGGRPHDSTARTALDGRARGATVVEVPGSHAVYVSRADAVAGLIATAAAGAREMVRA